MCHAGGEGAHREAWRSGRRQGEGGAWERVFIVVSAGRNRQGRVSRLRAGSFE